LKAVSIDARGSGFYVAYGLFFKSACFDVENAVKSAQNTIKPALKFALGVSIVGSMQKKYFYFQHFCYEGCLLLVNLVSR